MAGVPSKIITDKIKRVSSKNVPYSYNKSEVSLEGPRGSGTMTTKDIPRKPIAALRSRPGSKTYGVTQPTGTGKNIAGRYDKINPDGTKIYFEVPEPNDDRRTNVGGTQSNVKPAVGQDAGQSRPAPKKGLAASLVNASKSAPKTAPKPKTKIRPYT